MSIVSRGVQSRYQDHLCAWVPGRKTERREQVYEATYEIYRGTTDDLSQMILKESSDPSKTSGTCPGDLVEAVTPHGATDDHSWSAQSASISVTNCSVWVNRASMSSVISS